jgi:hypothetical protein
LAVVFLPVLHGYPLFDRWGGDDPQQGFSQPIPYEVFQYAISDRSWEGADVFGLGGGGWKWYYIGAIALVAAFSLAPLALVLNRWRRLPLISAGLLTLAILAWAGNKYTPVHYIYELIPFLYNFRFPNRLLVIAASPLLVVAGLGWQGLYRYLRQWGRAYSPVWWLIGFVLVAVMAASIVDVYNVNKAFAFRAGESVDHTLENSLTWLKGYDHGLYYTQIGENEAYPPGVSIAYRYEMPLINFDYTRRLLAWDRQHQNDVPFIATPKYYVATPAIPGSLPLPLPANAQKIYSGPGSYDIWYAPDALPAAFSAPSAQLQAGAKLPREMASALDVHYDGPNDVVVTGEPAREGDQLVVLVNDYPGWELQVDGKPAPLLPINDYLGAAMLPGRHTYRFVFRSLPFTIGLAISVATLLLMLGLLLKESPWPKRALPKFTRSALRSEERRVGKECHTSCRSRWSPYH